MTQYIWNPGGISGQSIVVKTQATYTLTTINPDGCKAHDTTRITVPPNNLKPPAIADTNVCYGETATLIVAASNVSWFSIPLGGTPIATGSSYTTTNIYGLTTYYVSDVIGGCVSPRKPVNVDTTDCSGTYIPNVFTPNGDGSNDKFTVTIKGAKCFKGEIFNRWGVKVYEWTDPLGGWNGKIQQTNMPASDGVYYFIITYCDYLGAPGTKHGFLSLVR